MYAHIFKKEVLSKEGWTPEKRAAATRKAWLSRQRAKAKAVVVDATPSRDTTPAPKATAPKESRADAKRRKEQEWADSSLAAKYQGKDIGWTADDGSPLSEKDVARIKAVGTPPGWTKVRLAKDPEAKLQVVGYDAAGRRQPKYNKEFLDNNQVEKFARVGRLTQHIEGMNSETARIMADKTVPQRERDTAAMLNLVLKTGFRPDTGDDTDAKVKSYGASSLEKRHIKIKGDVVSFDFIGKSGHRNTKRIKDPELAAYLSEKLANLKPKEAVFTASSADATKKMKELTGAEFKVKDLRTWNGTALAMKIIKSEPVPANEQQLKAQQKRVSKLVGEHLNNGAAMSLKNYIDPLVWKVMGPSTVVQEKS